MEKNPRTTVLVYPVRHFYSMIYLYVTLFLACIKVGKVILKPKGKKKGKKEYNAQNQTRDN